MHPGPTPPPAMPHARGGIDRGLTGILLSNALTLAIALWQQWNVLDLLWPFYFQSLVIGWYARRRLLLAPHLVAANITINGRRVTDPEQARRFMGGFFVLHYGLFHLVYAIFLAVATVMASGGGIGASAANWPLYALLALSFWATHLVSHREHVASDTARPRSMVALMGMPYLRILPMHLAIILIVTIDAGRHEPWFVAMFMALKTLADAGMHVLEHRILRAR